MSARKALTKMARLERQDKSRTSLGYRMGRKAKENNLWIQGAQVGTTLLRATTRWKKCVPNNLEALPMKRGDDLRVRPGRTRATRPSTPSQSLPRLSPPPKRPAGSATEPHRRARTARRCEPSPEREALAHRPRPGGGGLAEAFSPATRPRRADAPRCGQGADRAVETRSKAADAHLRHLRRDGTNREGECGRLHGPETNATDGRELVERGREDRHQFRLSSHPKTTTGCSTRAASPAT